jgi:hypothetical protein
MPNWCRNEMKVSFSNYLTPEAEREAFLEALKESIANYGQRLQRMFTADKKHGTYYYWGKDHKRNPLDFNNFIPYPENFKQRDDDAQVLSKEEMAAKYGVDKRGFSQDGYNAGGYEWCIENWGSKWNASTTVWVGEHDTMYFDTPWGPVHPIISEIHKRFPEISIHYEYYERGAQFMGGCAYLSERDLDETDIPEGKEIEVEDTVKKEGKPPTFEWKAGQAYNVWEQEYFGFKGG